MANSSGAGGVGPSVSRRSFVKASGLASGAFFINTKFNHLLLADEPASPPTTPWAQPLAFAPYAQPLPPGMMLDPLPIPAAHQRWDDFNPTKYYEMPIREVLARPHPELGLSRLSTYGGSAPGPTFITRCYQPIMVRFKNELPHEMQGFGVPETITHLHNGNNAPDSDGFPGDRYGPGHFKDHLYPNYPANGNPLECKGTLWYHDHTLDFTAQNTYRGLAGFYISYDELDSGNEIDPNPNALRLPSGIPNGANTENCYDIPLAFADRRYDQNGILTFDPFDFDGYIGDKWLVNGRVQPYFNVKRRKYRFRILDSGPARYYDFWFSNRMEFQVIGADGNLLPHPVTATNLVSGAGERWDIVVDFSQLPESTTEVYIVNRLSHSNGRGPDSGRLPMNEAPRLLKFVIEPGAVPDPSRVPADLRPLEPVNLTGAINRSFKWTRNNGMWAVNNNLYDEHRIDTTFVQNQWYILKFSTPGGWAHPIHFHVEEGRLLRYNKRQINGGILGGRKDVFALFGGDEMDVAVRFRDWVGRYVMHCHNGIHEDHAMMVNFEIVR
jgi:FtsP/CotA-like multicopper oxidase with cupredoxin domain